MEATEARPISIRLIIGSFLVAVGFLLTFDALGLFDADPILRWWSLVLVGIGVVLALEGRWIAGVIWTVIGAWILGWNLGFLHWSIWDMWPLILICIGTIFVRQGLFPRDEATPSESDSRVDMFGCLYSSRRVISSADFRGGNMTAVMGGAELDLTRADVGESAPVVDVFAFWGGIVIRVPETWSVIGRVTPFMAGFEDKSRPVAGCTKHLVVRGFVMMGGIEIKN